MTPFTRPTFHVSLLVCCILMVVIIACQRQATSPSPGEGKTYTTWSSYLGGPGRNHFSTLSQIDTTNVRDLQVAWAYQAPDSGQMQMSPIVVDTLLYGVTAALRLVALHAATGKEVWRFGDSLKVWHSTSRGVSYWEKGEDKRIFFTRGPDLYALDAITGKPVPGFGAGGKVDLRSGLPEEARDKFVISNTPGTVYKDLIFMPVRVSEDVGAAPGDIMAFSTITGEVKWVFHTIPRPGEYGFESWGDPQIHEKGQVGAANNWAGMAVDDESGILFVPTGSAAPDFYGGLRQGDNLFANCLLALNANTGERLWHFQFTRHDLWDRDPPAPPNLIQVKREGRYIPAVAQVTKQGYVYVFDRESGTPLFDIENVAVPASTLEGEASSPTQPLPKRPKPFARQSVDITAENISPFAPNREELVAMLRQADTRLYAPPSLQPVFLFPGYDGAAEWGGAAAAPEEGILYVNSNEMAWILQMEEPGVPKERKSAGAALYDRNCAVCHQQGREGVAASGYPSLIGIKNRMSEAEIRQIIRQGRGMMTGFPHINSEDMDALLRFLQDETDKQEVASPEDEEYALPYRHTGYHKFLDSEGLPAIDPPWGSLHAIDLNTGDYLWSIPLGETPGLTQADGRPTGTENYGGPVVTKNGLLFIAGTKDGYFRAFNRHSGEMLWKHQLPAPAFATPAVYQVNGKQYIALACGGEKLGTPKGNQILAFSLD